MITAHIELPLTTIDASPVRRGEERWCERAAEAGDPALVRFATDALADRTLGGLLRSAFAYSPFLTQELTGHVAFIRDSISYASFMYLITRNGGEVVSDF